LTNVYLAYFYKYVIIETVAHYSSHYWLLWGWG